MKERPEDALLLEFAAHDPLLGPDIVRVVSERAELEAAEARIRELEEGLTCTCGKKHTLPAQMLEDVQKAAKKGERDYAVRVLREKRSSLASRHWRLGTGASASDMRAYERERGAIEVLGELADCIEQGGSER